MRKSTTISMSIILLALVGMMIAADMALKPVKRDIAIARELTVELETRGEIVAGSKAVTVARKPEERHLAKEGWGMIVELEPSERVRTRKGQAQKLAYRAARSAGALYARARGPALEWFEIRMMAGGEAIGRTLIRVDETGQMSRQEPPLPETLPGASDS